MNPEGQTIRSLIDHYAEISPNRQFVAFPESGNRYTWSEFRERVRAVASRLVGLGLPPGAPVSGLHGNGQAALELFLGGMYGGFQVLH